MRALTSLAYLLGAASAAGAALYLVVYLYRWEWQRALICGVLLLVVEVLLVGAALLARLGRLHQGLLQSEARTEAVLRRLERSKTSSARQFHWLDGGPAAAGPPTAGSDSRGGADSTPTTFAWPDDEPGPQLREPGNTNRNGGPGPPGPAGTFVFVPVLMATGAALSVVALFLQKLAATTVRPGVERRLAGRLATLSAPPLGALGPPSDDGKRSAGGGGRGMEPASLAERPAVPPARPLRAASLTAASLVGAVALFLLIDFLSDATQTRRSPTPTSAASTVVFRVEVRNSDTSRTRSQAAQALWEGCRRSTSVLSEHAPLTALDTGVFLGAVRPGLSAHDLHRLHGCLSDARHDRVRAEVLGQGQATADR